MTQGLAPLQRSTQPTSEFELLGGGIVRSVEAGGVALDAEPARQRDVQVAQRTVGASIVSGDGRYLTAALPQPAGIHRLEQQQPG